MARLCLLLMVVMSCTILRADTLDALASEQTYRAARVSSTDPDGHNNDSRRIDPGQTRTLAELKGPGCITHLWFTYLYPARNALRKMVIRIYFDGAATPCVEAPLGDFFGLGHGIQYEFASQAIAIGTHQGLNCYWKMPYAENARITVTNEGRQPCTNLYYYVDFRTYAERPAKTFCFHAHYSQAFPCVKGEPYVMLEARGNGHFVGTNLSIEQGEDSWWGEGDDQIFIDGETTASLLGTGSEDYYSGAWCYWNEFAYPYIGMPLRARFLADGKLDRYVPGLQRDDASEWHWPVAWRKGDLWNVYRHHIPDPIPFRKSIKVQIEHGWINNERQDHYSSVAYWYQQEPHTQQRPMPDVRDRIPMFARLQERGLNLFEAEDFIDDAITSGGELHEADQTVWGNAWSRKNTLDWSPKRAGNQLSLPIPVARETTGGLTLELSRSRAAGTFDIALDDQVITSGLDMYGEVLLPMREAITFDVPALTTGSHTLRFTATRKNKKSEAMRLGMDRIFLYQR